MKGHRKAVIHCSPGRARDDPRSLFLLPFRKTERRNAPKGSLPCKEKVPEKCTCMSEKCSGEKIWIISVQTGGWWQAGGGSVQVVQQQRQKRMDRVRARDMEEMQGKVCRQVAGERDSPPNLYTIHMSHSPHSPPTEREKPPFWLCLSVCGSGNVKEEEGAQ